MRIVLYSKTRKKSITKLVFFQKITQYIVVDFFPGTLCGDLNYALFTI